MSKDFGPGIFDMEFINSCAKMTFTDAVRSARELVDSSSATTENKAKAHAMINKARTTTALLFGMSNFSLSHQGLKVMK